MDGVNFLNPGPEGYIAVGLVLVLQFLSGVVSGSEIAFFGLTPTDLSRLNPEDSAKDRKIDKLRDESQRTLATILCLNNFINVLIIMLCAYAFEKFIDFKNIFWLQFVVETVVLTFLLLLFGEIIPKMYARQNPLKYCRTWGSFIFATRKLVWPVATMLMRSGAIAEKVIHNQGHSLSVDDLEQALELTDKSSIKKEQTLLQGIIRFGDETVKDVMTLRQDMIGLDVECNFKQVLETIVANKRRRIPVFEESADNIKGILYTKDLLPHLNESENFNWLALVRPPLFVPETKKIDDLLREFQKSRIHIAIVVDEYGGTNGLITFEDIIEEIVGEINDEYDKEKKAYTMLNNNTYVFEGKTLLSDFSKALNIDDDIFEEISGDADTIAGIMLELKGDFLKPGEKVDFKNLTFEAVDIEGHRIAKVKVIVHKT